MAKAFHAVQQIKSRKEGEPYYTYRLVESERIKGRMKQHILLNLGRHFDVPKQEWRSLASRIEQLLDSQAAFLSIELSAELESLAQHYAAQILASRCEETTGAGTFQSLDPDTLELVRPRRVGIEQLALHAIEQLALREKLGKVGFNRHQLAAALGSIVARMAFPASELASHNWLGQRSGLGELLGYDFEVWDWIDFIRPLINSGSTKQRWRVISTVVNVHKKLLSEPLCFPDNKKQICSAIKDIR